MSKFLCERFSSLEPYEPGEQLNDKKYIKLNTNESPFPPSPKVKQVITESEIDSLNLYSDPTLYSLRAAIAESFSLDVNNVFCANGSDDVIAFSIFAFCSGKDLVCPDITYSFYPVFCNLFNANLTQIPLREDFSVCASDYFDINKNIIIANPNAPTGLTLRVDEIEAILQANPGNLVIIDEAYADFSSVSSARLVKKYNNIMVIQTFSKSRSLAGLRLGFALANESIISDLEKIRFSFNPYNVNSLSLRAGEQAMKDKKYYDACIKEIINTREYTKAALSEMGFEVTDSQTNFVFTKPKNISAEKLYLKLRESGILVRYFSKPRINEYLRISIGTKEQMDVLINQIKTIIGR